MCPFFLFACGSRRDKVEIKSQLISEAEQFGVDTVKTDFDEILCNADVDDVLRHYPELYYAVKNAQKCFGQWREQEMKTGIAVKTDIKDFNSIMTEALLDTSVSDIEVSWPTTSKADSLYLLLIANTDNLDKKNEVGKAYKAWQSYMDKLYHVMQVMPKDCRQRFVEIIVGVSDKHDENLKKCVSKK